MSAAPDLTGATPLPLPPRTVGRITATYRAIALPPEPEHVRSADGWHPERATVPAPAVLCPDCGELALTMRGGRGECTECLAVATVCVHGWIATERHPCLVESACPACGMARCICGVEDEFAPTPPECGV